MGKKKGFGKKKGSRPAAEAAGTSASVSATTMNDGSVGVGDGALENTATTTDSKTTTTKTNTNTRNKTKKKKTNTTTNKTTTTTNKTTTTTTTMTTTTMTNTTTNTATGSSNRNRSQTTTPSIDKTPHFGYCRIVESNSWRGNAFKGSIGFALPIVTNDASQRKKSRLNRPPLQSLGDDFLDDFADDSVDEFIMDGMLEEISEKKDKNHDRVMIFLDGFTDALFFRRKNLEFLPSKTLDYYCTHRYDPSTLCFHGILRRSDGFTVSELDQKSPLSSSSSSSSSSASSSSSSSSQDAPLYVLTLRLLKDFLRNMPQSHGPESGESIVVYLSDLNLVRALNIAIVRSFSPKQDYHKLVHDSVRRDFEEVCHLLGGLLPHRHTRCFFKVGSDYTWEIGSTMNTGSLTSFLSADELRGAVMYSAVRNKGTYHIYTSPNVNLDDYHTNSSNVNNDNKKMWFRKLEIRYAAVIDEKILDNRRDDHDKKDDIIIDPSPSSSSSSSSLHFSGHELLHDDGGGPEVSLYVRNAIALGDFERLRPHVLASVDQSQFWRSVLHHHEMVLALEGSLRAKQEERPPNDEDEDEEEETGEDLLLSAILREWKELQKEGISSHDKRFSKLVERCYREPAMKPDERTGEWKGLDVWNNDKLYKDVSSRNFHAALLMTMGETALYWGGASMATREERIKSHALNAEYKGTEFERLMQSMQQQLLNQDAGKMIEGYFRHNHNEKSCEASTTVSHHEDADADDSSNILPTLRSCQNCGSPNVKTAAGIRRSCSRCKRVAYCSRSCQTAAWKEHRNVCSESSSASPPPSLPMENVS